MNRSSRHTTAWLAVISLLTHLLTLSTVQAQTAWTNAAGGNWSDAGSWSPGVSPGPGTNAFLTNSLAAYTVSNDVLNNSFNNLTIYNFANQWATLFSGVDGFNPAGDVSIGYYGNLTISNSTTTIGGSVTVSNTYAQLDILSGANVTVNGTLNSYAGVLLGGSNGVLSVLGGGFNRAPSWYPYLPYAPTDLLFWDRGTLNVGGTTAASANNSFVSFTNAGSMTFQGYGHDPIAGTINASTNQVGFYNSGLIQTYFGSGYINATMVNETNGLIAPDPYGAQITIERFPTNRGSIYLWNYYSGITVNKGDFVNQGRIHLEYNPFSVLGGAFINDTNGVLDTSLYGTPFYAQSVLNRGLIAVTSSYAGSLTFYCPLTNEGTITLYRSDYIDFGRSVYAAMYASNIVNSGTILAQAETNVFTHTSHPTFMNEIANPVTNLAGGIITTTNGALLGFYPTTLPKNYGTFIVNPDSAIGMGAYDYTGYYDDKTLYVGFSDYQNDGTIDLRGGTFGAGSVSNVTGAIVKGWGDVGFTIYSNIVSTSGLTTNYARQFTAESIKNSGSIMVNGTLNAGAVNNNPGGLIMGSGVVTSSNSFNYFDGETLSTSNVNTGARVLNTAGATILASGGLLVLQNGLVNDSNAGTIGATNGGILQIGDGTMALTNNGLISVHNGGLNLGYLHNNGTIEIVDSNVTFSNKLFNAGRYISDPSVNTFLDDVTIAPSGTLEGGPGDVFDFKKNLYINSTNTSLFDLVDSTVSFSGGGDHTNAITGIDFDNSPAFGEAHGYRATNFAYGTLMLGPTDNLYLIDGDGNPSNLNGLYISVLDIGGTTNNLSLLHTPFNIYYRNGITGNEYLGGLTYALDGGGFLIAVPEPSSMLLLLTAGAVLLRRRSQ